MAGMCDCKRPAGFPMCHCAGCHRWFSGVSAHAEHQTVGPPEGLVCHDPAARGLIVQTTAEGGVELWGWPRRGAGPETRRHEEAEPAAVEAGWVPVVTPYDAAYHEPSPPESEEVATQPYRAAAAAAVRALASDAAVPLAVVAPALAEADRVEAEFGAAASLLPGSGRSIGASRNRPPTSVNP